MLLNAFASVLSSSQSSGMEDTTVYPFWLSLICFAIVPAIIEEYIFRGVILGAYLKVEMMAAVLISSLLQSIGFKMVWVIQSKMQMLCLTIGADGNAIDLLFLDIDLITTSGVDIGQYIRHRLNNYSMEIVFMCLLRRIMQSRNEQQITPSVVLIIVPIISIWSTA